MTSEKENNKRRIPKDKEDIEVTPLGTKKKKRDVPDQNPSEEFIEPKPNKQSSKNEEKK